MSSIIQPPKGTRDFLPEEMVLRKKVMETIRESFALYGFLEIDTPVFEYFELLSRKCGSEVEKEIYTFEDKAKRKLGLRFEFTSPLGRYYGTNRERLTKPFKRYAIGKVYRYENTQAGRYREFYQADADIIGSYSMDAELELLDLAVFVLGRLKFDNYEIIINNRKILDGIIAAVGIAADKKDAALRALDKLAKIDKSGVVKEFAENGIGEDKFEAFIGFIDFRDLQYSENNGEKEKLNSLKNKLKDKLEDESDNSLSECFGGIEDLLLLFDRVAVLGLGGLIKYDPLLVRGLGYYTGPIFEIKSKDVNIGSFAAGGRYDNLVELYGARPEGACGISFGVERIIDIITQKDKEALINLGPVVEYYIVYLTENERIFAYKTANILRSAGISVELRLSVLGGKVDISKEIKYASKKGIKYIAIIGEKEVSELKLTVKNIKTREEKYLSVEEILAEK